MLLNDSKAKAPFDKLLVMQSKASRHRISQTQSNTESQCQKMALGSKVGEVLRYCITQKVE
jgi:hypothetical protein